MYKHCVARSKNKCLDRPKTMFKGLFPPPPRWKDPKP